MPMEFVCMSTSNKSRVDKHAQARQSSSTKSQSLDLHSPQADVLLQKKYIEI